MRLVVQNLEIGYAGITLLQQLNFTVQSGNLLAIHGSNGIGKTTLLRTIAGLHKGRKGTTFIEHQDKMHRLQLFAHYLGEKNAMKAPLSLIDNINFWARFYGKPTTAWQPLLIEIGLADLEHLPLRALSTGQKRRLGFIRLLLHERPLWLLDEPTAGLDTRARDFMAHHMRQHLTKGGMIVAATHMPLGINPQQSLNLTHHQRDQQQ